MMIRGMMVATAPGLMKYLSAALRSVWVSPGLISPGATGTTEHTTGIICRITFLYFVTKKRQRQRGGSREHGRKMKEERKSDGQSRRV